MRILYFLLASLFAMSCFAQEGPYGENILQKFPLPVGVWDTYQAEDGSGIMWVEKNNVEKVTLSVLKNSTVTVQEFKAYDKNLGKTNCAAFDIHAISDDKTNGYNSSFWKTACTHKDNSVSTTLYKAVKGNDAFYLVKKTWLSIPSKENFSIWSNYFGSMSVCDTRTNEHPCPSLEKL